MEANKEWAVPIFDIVINRVEERDGVGDERRSKSDISAKDDGQVDEVKS